MKKFQAYRHIRRQAYIMGLPISLFAVMMSAIIASLLFIIFSFSVYGVITVFIVNTALYMVLTQLTVHLLFPHFKKVFPKSISNKKGSPINYEEN